MADLFTYIWEFEVPSNADAELQRHYGPNGTWVALFRQDPEYIETLLLKDTSRPGRYVTIDRWRSADAYHSFLERFAKQYEGLDRLCAVLTVRETNLGLFSEFSSDPTI